MVFGFESVIRIALIKGKKVNYDACSEESDVYDETTFSYIGFGTIHKINGYKQSFKNGHHFWVKRR